MKRSRSKMYAVRRGRSVGLFDNYEDVRASVERFQGAEHKSFSNYEDAVAYLQESGVQVQPGYSVTSSSRHFSQGSQNQTSNDVATIGYIVIDSETDLITDNMENSLANRKGKDCSAIKSNGTQHRVEGIVEDLIARSHTMSDGIHASPSSFYELFFDGASRGNPGEAGSAAVIIDSQGNTVAELYASLPYGSTNNEAEYGGLLLGLHAAINIGVQRLAVKGDSQLVIRQLQGSYQVRNDRLKVFYLACQSAFNQLGDIKLEHIPRELNSKADALANYAVDARL